jgi:hypothetical protein
LELDLDLACCFVISFRRDFRQGVLMGDEIEFDSWRRGFVDLGRDLGVLSNELGCVFGGSEEGGEDLEWFFVRRPAKRGSFDERPVGNCEGIFGEFGLDWLETFARVCSSSRRRFSSRVCKLWFVCGGRDVGGEFLVSEF